jgi:tRNA-2-methylthio-N6-dimethylallyladenosine synthase
MSDDLIAAHAENAKLMPYLHLPVQAGSNRIRRAMNRGHDSESYLKLVERIRAARPDVALSGDFIVGFPGETEADDAPSPGARLPAAPADRAAVADRCAPEPPRADGDERVPQVPRRRAEFR